MDISQLVKISRVQEEGAAADRLTVKHRNKAEQEDMFEVLHQVIGCRAQSHRRGLRDQIVEDLCPADKVEWHEDEVLKKTNNQHECKK